jgi:hypothetical protein
MIDNAGRGYDIPCCEERGLERPAFIPLRRLRGRGGITGAPAFTAAETRAPERGNEPMPLLPGGTR